MSPADRKLYAQGQQTPEEAIARCQAASERQLQGFLVNVLRLRGVAVLWHRTDKKSAATVGWPDLTFAAPRTAFQPGAHAWEVKLPGEVPTSEQILCHCAMIKNGWTVEIVHSVDEGIAFLNAIGIRAAT